MRTVSINKRLSIVLLLVLGSCTPLPPKNPDNLCSIFRDNGQWYNDAQKVTERWGTPIPVAMAIMYQESHFVADARPPRTLLLGFIPWFRPTSAYGYAQAIDATWELYVENVGSFWSDREDFADALDFIGWYNRISNRKLGITKSDTKKLYLAYHEGFDGYAHKSYLKKPWLGTIANKVAVKARQYQTQLKQCQLN